MPMNEFGEIVRSGASTGTANNSSSNRQEGSTSTVSTEVEEHFRLGRKRNFNIITLVIGTPLYAIIGYFAAEYYLYETITGITGAIIGGIIALICILIYNNIWAKQFEGYEYLISLLSAGIVLAVVGVALLVLYIVIKILIAILGIIVVLAIVAGFLGG